MYSHLNSFTFNFFDSMKTNYGFLIQIRYITYIFKIITLFYHHFSTYQINLFKNTYLVVNVSL